MGTYETGLWDYYPTDCKLMFYTCHIRVKLSAGDYCRDNGELIQSIVPLFVPQTRQRVAGWINKKKTKVLFCLIKKIHGDLIS